MSRFPNAKNLFSRLAVAQGMTRAAQRLKSTRMFPAGSYLKPLLVQVANALIHSRKHPEFC